MNWLTAEFHFGDFSAIQLRNGPVEPASQFASALMLHFNHVLPSRIRLVQVNNEGLRRKYGLGNKAPLQGAATNDVEGNWTLSTSSEFGCGPFAYVKASVTPWSRGISFANSKA